MGALHLGSFILGLIAGYLFGSGFLSGLLGRSG